jgi:DNA-binding CsgD family transcriptional regulator
MTPNKPPLKGWDALSAPSEGTILEHLMVGKTHEQIAQERGIATKTIEWHVMNIRAKLDATSEAQVIANGHGASRCRERMPSSRCAKPNPRLRITYVMTTRQIAEDIMVNQPPNSPYAEAQCQTKHACCAKRSSSATASSGASSERLVTTG